MSSDKNFSTYLKNQYEKRVLLHCYVDEKWLTNLDLQVFHLKKTRNARLPLSLWQEQEWVKGQNCGGKCLEASGRKAWILKLP